MVPAGGVGARTAAAGRHRDRRWQRNADRADRADDEDAALISALVDASPAVAESSAFEARREKAVLVSTRIAAVRNQRRIPVAEGLRKGQAMAGASIKEPPLELKVRPGQIELAKLKFYLDERLGEVTPEIIKEIAELGS